MNPFRPFWGPSRQDPGWFSAGLASSFPDIGADSSDSQSLAQVRLCGAGQKPGCKAFYAPKDNTTRTEVDIGDDAMGDAVAGSGLKDQVLVFQYKGKFHAIDHRCPHASYPLSQGSPFDIEDFGMVLSAGVTCPKHGWSFDMHTGMSDRAQYKLGVWEVELRHAKDAEDAVSGEADKEVWVRRKPRRG